MHFFPPLFSSVKHLGLVCLALGFANLSFGLALTGTVYDYTTGAPIQGAVVHVIGRADIESTFTDAQGVYHIPPIPVTIRNLAQEISLVTSGDRVASQKLYDLRGRNISSHEKAGAGGWLCSSRLMKTGCFVLKTEGHAPLKVVLARSAAINRNILIPDLAGISASALGKTMADGDSSGRIAVSKNGYLVSTGIYVRSIDTVPRIRLLGREQPLGACGNTIIESAVFSLTGADTMTVLHPEMTDTINYCDYNDILETVYSVTYAGTTFNRMSALTATRLDLDNDLSSALTIDENNDGVAEAVLLGGSSWVRASGSDVNGTWQFAGYSYRVISGSLNAAQKQAYDIEYDHNSTQDLIRRLCMTVSGNSVTFAQSAQGDREANADMYFASTGSIMRDRLYGAALRANDSTVLIIGNRTRDTIAVAVTMDNGRRFHCVNNNPLFADYEYHGNPSTCPNRTLPSWWSDFINANLSDLYLGKISAMGNESAAQVPPSGTARRILK